MELIVFDLDGTLLNAQSEISEYTRETLKLLAQKDIAYTVATGRTLHSAQTILDGHGFDLPHVYNNGVLIWHPHSNELALENLLTFEESKHIISAATKQGVTPFVFSVSSQHETYVYHRPVQHDIEQYLIDLFLSRPGITLLPIDELNEDVHITNVSIIGSAGAVDAIEEDISNEEHLIAYSGPAIEGNGNKWMDVHHHSASKGSAIELLKTQLGVKKVICFGDSDNDLSMFAMADESYAPENAKDYIKDAATAIIGHHDQDGIARFLRERFNLVK